MGWKRRLRAVMRFPLDLTNVLKGLVRNFRPSDCEALHPVSIKSGKVLRPGDRFSVLTWNVQYAGSRENLFFYEGGNAVHVPEGRVRKTMKSIAGVIGQMSPDLVFLQEVDRDSDRTARIDQLQAYLDAGEWACWSSTPYHKSAYVPHPSWKHLGRVNFHLSILSSFALEKGGRIALPGLSESWIRRQFNLKRAIQWLTLPVEGGDPIRIANTHLSAFSFNDGTLRNQVRILRDWMQLPHPWLLAGDMNMLPPGDDINRFQNISPNYTEDPNPMLELEPERFDVARKNLLGPENRTYLPFGADEPDRKIDYLLASEDLELIEQRVLREANEMSDHLPIWAVFEVKK